MTRSMQPTLAKLNTMAQRTPAEISSANYRLGYMHGRQAAYRTAGYIATSLAAVVGIVAWVM